MYEHSFNYILLALLCMFMNINKPASRESERSFDNENYDFASESLHTYSGKEHALVANSVDNPYETSHLAHIYTSALVGLGSHLQYFHDQKQYQHRLPCETFHALPVELEDDN